MRSESTTLTNRPGIRLSRLNEGASYRSIHAGAWEFALLSQS